MKTSIAPARQFRLTEQQHKVLVLASQGYSDKDIARVLFLARDTVGSHMHNVLRRLNARNRAHAVYIAMKLGELK